MGVFDFGPDADSIKAELEDLDIEDLEVEVDDNGKVILSGTAASEKVAQKAVKIVSGLDGVEKVKNNFDIADEDEEEEEEDEEDEEDYDDEEEEEEEEKSNKKKKKGNGGGGGSGDIVHTVVPGDTLWGIAQKYYGDGNRYMEIFNANKAIWKNYGNNPNNIYPGWELHIP
jgi:nucleoid-associated protein YgaU